MNYHQFSLGANFFVFHEASCLSFDDSLYQVLVGVTRDLELASLALLSHILCIIQCDSLSQKVI